eukprot:472993_1
MAESEEMDSTNALNEAKELHGVGSLRRATEKYAHLHALCLLDLSAYELCNGQLDSLIERIAAEEFDWLWTVQAIHLMGGKYNFVCCFVFVFVCDVPDVYECVSVFCHSL